MTVLRTPPTDLTWVERLGSETARSRHATGASPSDRPSISRLELSDRAPVFELPPIEGRVAIEGKTTPAAADLMPVQVAPDVPAAPPAAGTFSFGTTFLTASAFASPSSDELVQDAADAVPAPVPAPAAEQFHTPHLEQTDPQGTSWERFQAGQVESGAEATEHTEAAPAETLPAAPLLEFAPSARDAAWYTGLQAESAGTGDVADASNSIGNSTSSTVDDTMTWPRVVSAQLTDEFAHARLGQPIPLRPADHSPAEDPVAQANGMAAGHAELHQAAPLSSEPHHSGEPPHPDEPMDLPEPMGAQPLPAVGLSLSSTATASAQGTHGGQADRQRGGHPSGSPTVGGGQGLPRRTRPRRSHPALAHALSVHAVLQPKKRRSLAVAAGLMAAGLAVASIASLSELATATAVSIPLAQSDHGNDGEAASQPGRARAAQMAAPRSALTTLVVPVGAPAAPTAVSGSAWRTVAHAPSQLVPPEPVAVTLAPAMVPTVVQAARSVRVAALDPQVELPARVASTMTAPTQDPPRAEPGPTTTAPGAIRPRLILDMSVPAQEATRVPFPIRIDNGDPSIAAGRLVIRGLPDQATLSRGRLAALGTWQVPAANLQDLSLSVPPLTPGEFELLIELRAATGELVSSGLSVVRVVPRPRSNAAGAATRRAALDPAQSLAGAPAIAEPLVGTAAATTAPSEVTRAIGAQAFQGDGRPAGDAPAGDATADGGEQRQDGAAGARPSRGDAIRKIRRVIIGSRLGSNDPNRSRLGAVESGPRRGGGGDYSPASVFDQRKGI